MHTYCIFTCFAVVGRVQITSVQTSKQISSSCTVNNKTHLWGKNLFCSEIIKNYNTLIPLVIKSSFWWNCVLLCFHTGSCLCKQALCFTISSVDESAANRCIPHDIKDSTDFFKAKLILPDEYYYILAAYYRYSCCRQHLLDLITMFLGLSKKYCLPLWLSPVALYNN